MISLWSVWLSTTKKCLIPKRGCMSWGSCSRELSQLGCEFLKDRELESQFEYFEFMDDGSYVPKLAYRSLAGLKIFGGCSRALPKKSLRLVSRARYENSYFQYPFLRIKKTYKNTTVSCCDLVVKTASTPGFPRCVGELFGSGFDVDKQSYQPAVVYVNGEYWGLYHLREKINEEFLARVEGVDASQHSYQVITGNVTWPNACRDVIQYLG